MDAHKNIYKMSKVDFSIIFFKRLLVLKHEKTKLTAACTVRKGIDTLSIRYKNNEIYVDQLLNGLSLTIAKRKK